MARDIPAGTDTTATVEADDFVRGVLDRRGTTTGTGSSSTPAATSSASAARRRSGRGSSSHPARRERRRVDARTDDAYFGRSAHRVRGHRRSRDLVPRRQRQGPLTVPRNSDGVAGRRVGHATGDFALSVNQLDGSPVDAIAGAQCWSERVIDVFFVPDGQDRRVCSRRPHHRIRRLEHLPDPEGDGRARRLFGRLRHQLPPDRQRATRPTSSSCTYDKPTATTWVSSSRPGPSAKAPAASPAVLGRSCAVRTMPGGLSNAGPVAGSSCCTSSAMGSGSRTRTTTASDRWSCAGSERDQDRGAFS